MSALGLALPGGPRAGYVPIVEPFPTAEADRAVNPTRQGQARSRAVLAA